MFHSDKLQKILKISNLFSSFQNLMLGTLSNDDGNAKENVIKFVYFGSFILLRNYSNSCELSNMAELSGS